jgi:DNA end-binding protein Ku
LRADLLDSPRKPMASTIWKGQLTFALVSFPVRLIRAARKERVPLRYIREVTPRSVAPAPDDDAPEELAEEPEYEASDPPRRTVAPVQQRYTSGQSTETLRPAQLQRGFEVAPEQFAVIRPEQLQRLRRATSSELQVLRSVRLADIDPVFFETSYYVLPDKGGDQSYALFYCALKETEFSAVAKITMHGREHIIIVRPGAKGLIAHTMFYVNEVPRDQEHATEMAVIKAKELELAKLFVSAIAEPFQPEEFNDSYREQLQELIASKTVSQSEAAPVQSVAAPKVVDIMEALRKSLREATKRKESPGTARKPSARATHTTRKTRDRKAG